MRLDHEPSLSTISETNTDRRRSRAQPGGRPTNPKNDGTHPTKRRLLKHKKRATTRKEGAERGNQGFPR